MVGAATKRGAGGDAASAAAAGEEPEGQDIAGVAVGSGNCPPGAALGGTLCEARPAGVAVGRMGLEEERGKHAALGARQGDGWLGAPASGPLAPDRHDGAAGGPPLGHAGGASED